MTEPIMILIERLSNSKSDVNVLSDLLSYP